MPGTCPCSGSWRTRCRWTSLTLATTGAACSRRRPGPPIQPGDYHRLPETFRSTCGGRSTRGGVTSNVLGLGGNYGWTQDVLYYSAVGKNWYHALQARFSQRFADGCSSQELHAAERRSSEHDDYWLFDPDAGRGPPTSTARTSSTSLVYELPFGKDKKMGTDWGGATEALLGGWQLNGILTIQSGIPINRRLPTRARTATRARAGPICRRHRRSARRRTSGSTRRRSDPSGSAFGRPRQGHVRRRGPQRASWPRLLSARRLAVQAILFVGIRRLEVRLEAVNLFNNVNLGQPNARLASQATPGQTPAESPPPHSSAEHRSGTCSSA